ncbi:MAG: hypothetical protein H7A46_09915 [Verrucomicrobiales bacterium]|nr:hypothetical protein [Verrucomicrobiales bacterium]
MELSLDPPSGDLISEAALVYQLTPHTVAANGFVEIRVSSAEGATADVRLEVAVEPLRPRLVAIPEQLQAGMLRGGQKAVEFDVVNRGALESGSIQISLPVVPWMALGTTNRIRDGNRV